MRLRSRSVLAWLWVGMLVIPLATFVSSASGAQHRRLNLFDDKIQRLTYQLRVLENEVNAAAARGAPQVAGGAWAARYCANQLRDVRAALAQLQTDVTAFQGRNRTANLAVGLRVADGLQAALTSVGRAIDGFALARDAVAAKTALPGISMALNGFIGKTADVPDCCLLTCCAIR